MEAVDKEILNIIHTRNNGEPVGFPTIDRMLLRSHENFILSGLLGKKLNELEEKGLIQSPPEQIGYTLTTKGIELFNSIS
jgi:DNA-binding HxlR family transcriptional regulator